MYDILMSAAVLGVVCFGLGFTVAGKYRAPIPGSALIIAGGLCLKSPACPRTA